MFYAVILCGNPSHQKYQRPVGFVVEEDDTPLETETEKEIEKLLKNHPLYNAGWIQIIEIE